MHILQKSFYILRAIFELSKHKNDDPIKTIEVTKAKANRKRFLEVTSNRFTVSKVIESTRWPFETVPCMNDGSMAENYSLHENCVLRDMRGGVWEIISSVFNNVTFSNLVGKKRR